MDKNEEYDLEQICDLIAKSLSGLEDIDDRETNGKEISDIIANLLSGLEDIDDGETNVKEINSKENTMNENNSKETNMNEINMNETMTAEELAYVTGLTEEQCQHYMDVNHMNGDQALESIDIAMEALNAGVAVPVEIAACMRNAGIYSKMASRLGAYNVMRGGVKGYGGFVFEELHAADAATKGVNITVLGDNGVADFIVKDASGKEILVQAKTGYHGPHTIDWGKYKGQTILVDKGNTALAAEARAAGLKVEESAIYKKEADVIARTQQFEANLTHRTSAPITGAAAGAHEAGLASAKLAARVGVSMKIGENIYDVVAGNKAFEDAAADVVVDGAVMVGGAYLGTAALTVAGTAASAAVGAASATAAGTAIAGAATAVGSTIAGTAVGGTALAGAAAVGGAVTGAVGAAAATAAALPLAPVLAVGAGIGFIGKFISDNW